MEDKKVKFKSGVSNLYQDIVWTNYRFKYHELLKLQSVTFLFSKYTKLI